jgi:hypothetical protein
LLAQVRKWYLDCVISCPSCHGLCGVPKLDGWPYMCIQHDDCMTSSMLLGCCPEGHEGAYAAWTQVVHHSGTAVCFMHRGRRAQEATKYGPCV